MRSAYLFKPLLQPLNSHPTDFGILPNDYACGQHAYLPQQLDL
jgi:hypothetical protein